MADAEMILALLVIGLGIVALLLRLLFIGYASAEMSKIEAPITFAILFFVLSITFNFYLRKDLAPVVELLGFISLFIAARKAIKFGDRYGFRR